MLNAFDVHDGCLVSRHALICRIREALIYSASGMKRKEPGAQKARHIMEIGELSSTARRSGSPAQPINQRFLRSRAGFARHGGQSPPYSNDSIRHLMRDGTLASVAGDDLTACIGRILWLDRGERRPFGVAALDSLEAGEALNGERRKNDAAGFAATFRESGQ